jgi:uncharacterized protein YndB with AHSA1/START domain
MAQTLKFKRTVNVPPSEVYRAFIHATALRDWLSDAAQTEARPGGHLYVWMNSGYYAVGEFVKLEPGKKLVFTWYGKDEPAPTRVQVLLEAKDGGTNITLKHEQIGSGAKWAKTIQEIKDGWNGALENLQSVLETGIDLRVARTPRLGILIGDFNAEIAGQLGVPVTQGIRLEGTAEGTGAQAAGLQKDDVIVKLGGKKAIDFPSLTSVLRGYHAGDKVKVAFYRGGEKKMVTLELGRRPMPEVPETAAELAEIIRKSYAKVNAELAQLFEGVSEAEAEHRPASGAWNVKETIAHLIACERDFQSWMADMLNDNVVNDSLEFRPNVNERLRALVERFGTLTALMEELKHSQAETAAWLAALPAMFVARKHMYRRVATWMIDTVPIHYREEHLGAIRAAIQSAKNARSSLPQDMAELLDRIEREWAALEQAVAGLSEEQMNVPGAGGWSIKDHLAHLTAWEQFMLLYYLQGRPAHEVMQVDEATWRTLDENGINEILHQRSQVRPVPEVLADRRRSHEQVVATLEQTLFADLMKPYYPDDPQARPVIGWVIGNTYEHYQEHRAYIQAEFEQNRLGR